MNLFKAALAATCLAAALIIYPMPAPAEKDADHVAGVCYKIMDQNGKMITLTSRKPVAGDEIIKGDGQHYKITSVRGKTARARYLNHDKEFLAMVEFYRQAKEVPVSAQQWYDRPVGIYHTHSDESYLPSDGAASIPFKGGIFQVGDTFNLALKEQKAKVFHDKTPHDPHDSNAYYRSRRTVFDLLKDNPAALFDVHRDGVDDPSFYRRVVSNEEVTQIRLVVGRQNPKMSLNLDFAKRLMAYVNKKDPKLVKEIYLAHGNYNQDLLSTALLIEAGTYTNEKWEAKNGVSLLANAVPTVLGLTPPPPGAPKGINSREASRQGWKTAFFIITLIVIAGTIFVLVNESPGDIKRYISGLVEMINRRRP